ncbi:unnamed protein product [Ixodes pacificus]
MLKRISTPAGFIPGATMTVLDPSGNQGAELGTSANTRHLGFSLWTISTSDFAGSER